MFEVMRLTLLAEHQCDYIVLFAVDGCDGCAMMIGLMRLTLMASCRWAKLVHCCGG